jgi:hypothetical protein
MGSTSHSSTVIGIASCVASFLAGIAYANGSMRASAREPDVAVCIDSRLLGTNGDGSEAETVVMKPAAP